MPITLFNQYWLNQLWKRNLQALGLKHQWIDPTKKRKEDYDLVCAICGRDDVLFPYHEMDVSPKGLLKMHPQPQIRVKGIVIRRDGSSEIRMVPLKVAQDYAKSRFLPFVAEKPIRCPVTGEMSKTYYTVYNARVCRKCIWHKLGNKKGPLKIDGSVVEY